MNDSNRITFDDIWKYQKEFANKASKYFNAKRLKDLTLKERVEESKKYLLCLHGEINEVLNQLPWKDHRKSELKINRSNLLIELIDTQKFLWGLMEIWQVTKEEFLNTFIEKSVIVEKRWCQEMEPGDNNLFNSEKIAIVDIDGVLNDYPNCFYRWIKSKGINLNVLDDPIKYAFWKDKYRSSGIKRNILVKEGAKELLDKLVKLNYFVVIATNRPVVKYANLLFDTLIWLEKNNLSFNYLYWADLDNKILFFEEILDKIKLVIDDDETICNQFNKYNIPTILVNDKDSLFEVMEKIE